MQFLPAFRSQTLPLTLILVFAPFHASLGEDSPVYRTPPEFMSLYFNFGGYNDPAFPRGKETIPQALFRSEASNGPESSHLGPLVIISGSELYCYGSDRRLVYHNSFRATNDSGFFELTAVSHIGPAIAYLAKIKENGDPSWEPLLADLLEDIRNARQLNEQDTDHWLDRANIAPWRAYKEEIRNMVSYALAMSEDFLVDVQAGKEALTLENVQQQFLDGNEAYPIPFNTVMIGTFMLTALEEMSSIHDQLASVDLDWKNAMVIVRSQAGTNVTSGLTKQTNWMVPFLQALALGEIPEDHILIAPYAEHRSELGAEELSPAAYNYYASAVWGSAINRSRIARDVFTDIPNIETPDSGAIPGDYGFTAADQVDQFMVRLKHSMQSPAEMLSNSVGFWMAGELAAKQWDLSKVDIPGLTTGLPDGIHAYPTTAESDAQPLANSGVTDTNSLPANDEVLTLAWQLPTSGAREITPIELDGELYLAVAQLAADVPDTAPNMNGGTSDVDVLIFKLMNEQFEVFQRIPSHGNESAVFFQIGDESFLAVASIRSGPGPNYSMETYSKLYRWDGRRFYPIQQFLGFASKNWHAFTIGQRHFLALANGVTAEEANTSANPNSMIYEWDGERFNEFQEIPSQWAYEWESFEIAGTPFLALTDHLRDSQIYRWDGEQFVEFQTFEGQGGRAFEFFEIDGKPFLAWARISKPSIIYRWSGEQFVEFQTLPPLGGRNFTYFTVAGQSYLFQTLFITGTREAPQSEQQSPLYAWNGEQFEVDQHLTTYGGVSAKWFEFRGTPYLAVANSLSPDLRFRVDSTIYRINAPSTALVAESFDRD